MASIEPTEFTVYTFDSEREYLASCVFSEEQENHIQTEIAKFAQQKLNIAADDPQYNNPEIFVRAHEYHRGLISGLRYILELSRELKARQQELLKNTVVNQTGDFSSTENMIRDESEE